MLHILPGQKSGRKKKAKSGSSGTLGKQDANDDGGSSRGIRWRQEGELVQPARGVDARIPNRCTR